MRNFDKTKRVVIKIGTNTLAKGGGIDGRISAAWPSRSKA